jgi:hypothetical protein
MRIAILDDYFEAARHLADWSQLAGRADIRVFTEPLGGEDQAAKKLADFEIIVGMRERTPFPASLIRIISELRREASSAYCLKVSKACPHSSSEQRP